MERLTLLRKRIIKVTDSNANDVTMDPHGNPIVKDETSSPEYPARIGRYRIERVLGKGGFGLVYLAHDEQLHRDVAVKVPHAWLISKPEDAEAYLSEARTVANLDHAGIVPVHDVGSTAECPCYVVSKYIDGTDLATRVRQHRLKYREAAELVATVAEALHYAHKQGLVHRDVKPGNILISTDDKPFVVDFGLALREENIGKGPKYAGTPAYMSPEQARGEGHRVDGRSDIFSLGVVFYELLAGRKPFRGDTHFELREQITGHEPKPLLQYDEKLPKELQRICFKALSKRASDRYSSAYEMADDLRVFLAEQAVIQGGSTPGGVKAEAQATVNDSTPVNPVTPTLASQVPGSSDSPQIRIVPKGLRSFDAHDADFFLELLPGPRDRHGLPDSLRFWKARIEETDPDNTFSVGLIYGPSGCGKSSLVKAGLLPRLSEDVIPVYMEATADDTETRLLRGLRKRCPALDDSLSLTETLAALRRGQGIPVGRKVLIVLDQFEQWLHTRKEDGDIELVQALRQCDGCRVQCIVMVRDDFWLAVSRFMRFLEVRLAEGHNTALADLFDLDHARKVLAAFGRAFSRLPENTRETTKEQKDFLNESVAGLADEGKVICVRLALFAEMVKGKTWAPATLKEVGGTEGVGVTFLEETFNSSMASPDHRFHQKAARALLKALLPESGTDIKGQMKSRDELLATSGYVSRPNDFEDLLRILDGEIRLITPADPEGAERNDGCIAYMPVVQQFYQLTHDYLVPSLRDWLTRQQKETRKGRAELLLADRAVVWNARPENRQLPSLLQWLKVRWFTDKRNWTPQQRKMMQKANRYHAMLVVAASVVLALLGFVSWEGSGRLEGRRLRDRLLEATTPDVPGIVKDMVPYRRWVDPLLHDSYVLAEQENDSRRQLHCSVALLPVDSGQVGYLYERLLKGEPQEVVLIREALIDRKADLTERLWTLLGNPKNDEDQRFRAACTLAVFSPRDARWERASGDVAAALVNQKSFAIPQWTDALSGVGHWLIPPLADFLADENRSISERSLIVSIYGTYAADLPDASSRLEQELAVQCGPDAGVDARVNLAKKQASYGVALMIMGQDEQVWPLLKHGPDPTMRSYLIERLAPSGVDAKLLMVRLDEEQQISVKRAILLSLGEYRLDRLSLTERQNHLPRLLQLYQDEPDPGIHGASEWLLRQWQESDEIAEIDKGLATGQVEGKRRWYLNRQGQTMMVVSEPGEFWIGENKERHRTQIDRSFAMASKEVTVEQYLRFHKEHKYLIQFAPADDCPVNNVSWYEAAAYCNWLSEQEGIPKEQWCYVANRDGKYDEYMSMAPDYLGRTGYRLPTDSEWVYACRAGADTGHSFGEPTDLLDKYAWLSHNSLGVSHPVGTLKPNDLGLFDLHGNISEWCQDVFRVYTQGAEGKATQDIGDTGQITNGDGRVLRGGTFFNVASYAHHSFRVRIHPDNGMPPYGFRLARTYH